MIRRPVETYDAAKGPAIYRNQQWKKPVGPPLKMTYAEADAVPEYIQLNQPQIFRHGNITLNIEPGYLVRDQLILLRLIKDAFPRAPDLCLDWRRTGAGPRSVSALPGIRPEAGRSPAHPFRGDAAHLGAVPRPRPNQDALG